MSNAWCKRPGCPERHRDSTSSAVGAIWGPSEYGSLNIKECLQPRKRVPVEVALQECLASRTSSKCGEAVACREEMSERTGKSPRGTGPGAYTKIAEIMSGRANCQQGLATTCEDPPEEANYRSRGKTFGLAHEPV
jgi:hypothetical protein